jgi:hypothetical protein
LNIKFEVKKQKIFIFLFLQFLFIERNLNPKAACLRRREEEKSEDHNGDMNLITSQPPIHMPTESSSIDGGNFMEQMHQSIQPSYWQQ